MSSDPESAPTYHDLHITTAEIPRTSIFNLPYGLEAICNRVAGWELRMTRGANLADASLLAGEYADPEQWLVLDVAGHVIVDSRRAQAIMQRHQELTSKKSCITL